jgi:hypothetical protein
MRFTAATDQIGLLPDYGYLITDIVHQNAPTRSDSNEPCNGKRGHISRMSFQSAT